MKKDAKKGTETHAYKRKLRRKSRIKVRKTEFKFHTLYLFYFLKILQTQYKVSLSSPFGVFFNFRENTNQKSGF